MTSPKSVLTTIGLIIGVSVGIFFLGRISSKDNGLKEYDQKFKQYQEQVVNPMIVKTAALQKTADSAAAISDSLKNIHTQQTKQIAKLEANEVIKRTNNQKLEDSLKAVLPDTCKPALALVDSLTSEINNLHVIVLAEDSRDSVSEAENANLRLAFNKEKSRGDSLQTVINNWPKPPKPNKILGFIPHVSPRVAYVAGVISAVIAKAVWDNNVRK